MYILGLLRTSEVNFLLVKAKNTFNLDILMLKKVNIMKRWFWGRIIADQSLVHGGAVKYQTPYQLLEKG